LKLLFSSAPLNVNGQVIHIKPELQIVSRLAAGHVGQACRIGMRRLRASGLMPLPHFTSNGIARDYDWEELERLSSNSHRLAAALLLPVSRTSVTKLHSLVIRNTESVADTFMRTGGTHGY